MYGIFTYIYHKNQPNVGVYISPMDPMGYMVTVPSTFTLVYNSVLYNPHEIFGQVKAQRDPTTPPMPLNSGPSPGEVFISYIARTVKPQTDEDGLITHF